MNPLTISHLTLRRLIGVVGFLLPLILWASGPRESISDYHNSSLRDFFVGSMVAIGAFLFTYNGYSKTDAIAGRIAGISAVLIALCPHDSAKYGTIHLVAATVFLLTLAFFSIALFPKTSDPYPEPQKLRRNTVYYVCGLLILLGLVMAGVDVYQGDPLFWEEAMAVMAFGVSWLVKGEVILKDAPGT